MNLFEFKTHKENAIQGKANYINGITYDSIYNRAFMLAMRRFKWTGLPENIPEWFREASLFYHSEFAYTNDKNMGELFLPAFPCDMANVYYIPIRYRLQGFGFSEQYNTEDLIILRNNFIGRSTLEIIEPIIREIYDNVRATDVNILNSKLSVVWKTNKKKELTVKNLVNKVFNNEPAIFGEETQNINNIEIVNAEYPFLADKLDTHNQTLWSDLLTCLGIQTYGIEKRERVQVAEVQASNEQARIYKEAALNCRKLWAEEVNKKTGMNIDVEWIIEDMPILGGNITNEQIAQMGGGNFGTIHNGTEGNA